MGANVFANSMEVSCEKATNQSLAAMPDVCLSPPTPPAGPIPIPYPNFSKASDTTDGTQTVQIAGGQVGMKDKSCYKQSKGDEAATKSLGMGQVTACIEGKTYFAAWSSDVKFEGENAVRLSDMTTHNHGSDPMNTGSMTVSTGEPGTPGLLTKCQQLESANPAKVETDPSGKKVAVPGPDMRPSAASSAFTATSASFTTPGGVSGLMMPAVTPQDLIRSGSRGKFAEVRPQDQKMACSDKNWGMLNSNHTEPKLMEQFFPAPGNPQPPVPFGSLGSLTMSIVHNPKGGPPDAEPCTRCKKGICKAVECGLEIKLCKEGEEESPPCKDGEWVDNE